MGRMAETVIKKSNEAEKVEELKLLANINKLDKQAEERDRKKKRRCEKKRNWEEISVGFVNSRKKDFQEVGVGGK